MLAARGGDGDGDHAERVTKADGPKVSARTHHIIRGRPTGDDASHGGGDRHDDPSRGVALDFGSSGLGPHATAAARASSTSGAIYCRAYREAHRPRRCDCRDMVSSPIGCVIELSAFACVLQLWDHRR